MSKILNSLSPEGRLTEILLPENQAHTLFAKLTLRDVLPVFWIQPFRLPVTPGVYIDQETTLAIDPTQKIPSVPCFKGITVYQATQVLKTVFNQEATKPPIEQITRLTSRFVEKEDFINRLWDSYQINLACMTAMGHNHPLTSRNRWGRLHTHAESLVYGNLSVESQHIFSMNLKETKLREYYQYADVIRTVAFLELIHSGKLKVPLPKPSCTIEFKPKEEKAYVLYFNQWQLESFKCVPYQVSFEDKKSKDVLLHYFRIANELSSLREKAQTLYFNHVQETPSGKPLYFDLNQEGKIAEGYLVFNKVAALCEQYEVELMPLYLQLVEWAETHKENALQKVRYQKTVADEVFKDRKALASVSKTYLSLPNNMDGLPAHFAAIPSGLDNGIELTNDYHGYGLLRVKRASLEIKGQRPREHTPMTVPFKGLKEAEETRLLEQVKTLIGDNSPRWLVPQGVVAISKLYREKGGYDGNQKSIRIYLNEWIDTMRPQGVERFKEKGRGDAFGKKYEPKKLYEALIGFLERLTYENKGPAGSKEWSSLNGFYLKTSDGIDKQGLYVNLLLNPDLHKFIIGQDGLPYMLTNTEAMFSYDRGALDYAPAAQWAIEQLARINLYNRDTTTLSDPNGGGITRAALAHRFGLQPGLGESPSHLLRRLNNILESLGTAGVITDFKLDGPEKTGAESFGVKLIIDMHDDYRKAYNLARKERLLKHAEEELLNPFSPPKKKP